MSDIAQLKAFAQAAIDRRRDWIVSVAKTVASNPELGFREVATASSRLLRGERVLDTR
jgi:hypothetical protein